MPTAVTFEDTSKAFDCLKHQNEAAQNFESLYNDADIYEEIYMQKSCL